MSSPETRQTATAGRAEVCAETEEGKASESAAAEAAGPMVPGAELLEMCKSRDAPDMARALELINSDDTDFGTTDERTGPLL